MVQHVIIFWDRLAPEFRDSLVTPVGMMNMMMMMLMPAMMEMTRMMMMNPPPGPRKWLEIETSPRPGVPCADGLSPETLDEITGS